MIIIGIETSCDETAAAVLQKDGDRIQILSNVVASSASLQAKYGGIIPEQAAREQIKSIIPVIEESLQVAGYSGQEIDAIAVTYGPGLIGSLLVGVETAKVLATIWKKPLIPVNHLLGHFYANWIQAEHLRGEKKQLHLGGEVPSFPCLGLLVSGGHTDLVLFTDHGKYKYLGGTRDDAAGECFDKCARLLGLPYPGGPEISKLASQGRTLRFKLPIPMKGSKDLDFSYSGLKTAVANLLHTSEVEASLQQEHTSEVKRNLAAAIEDAIVQSLIDKVIQALKAYPVKNVMIAGGVAANQKLKKSLESRVKSLDSKITLHIPPANLCTDNAAMIAAAAFFSPRFAPASTRAAGRQRRTSPEAGEAGQKPIKNPLSLQADPNLTL